MASVALAGSESGCLVISAWPSEISDGVKATVAGISVSEGVRRPAALELPASDRYVKLEDEKPTVGILLCHSKDDRLVELTLPKDSNIHASAYQLYLPDKEALKKQLEDAQAEWEATHEDSSDVQNGGLS